MPLFKPKPGKIVKDARWLQPQAEPPSGKPLCRDAMLHTMASVLTGLFSTGKGGNLFIVGPPGSGKTLCVRYLLREIHRHARKHSTAVDTVYVNAGRTRTPYYTMLAVVKALGVAVPDSGWQLFRLKQAFERTLTATAVVLGVDEVDALLLKRREPLIYYLNRQPRTTLLLVSNQLRDAATLPLRLRSTLQPKLLALEPYTADEAKTILKERVDNALHPDVLPDHLLDIVAQATAHAGDIRLGFTILLSAARFAEDQGKTAIEADDVEHAITRDTQASLVARIHDLEREIQARQKRDRKRTRGGSGLTFFGGA
jgi:cell division control protein 6